MKRILFLDVTCPKPYTGYNLKNEAMGGTEATVIRIAEALAYEYVITVAQHNRELRDVVDGVEYDSIKGVKGQQFDTVVTLRVAGYTQTAKTIFPNAKHLLWLHDLPSPELTDNLNALRYAKPVIVTVSGFHFNEVHRMLMQADSSMDYVKLKKIYNPVDDDLKPCQDTVYNPYRLVFFSSPHKGLPQALEIYQYVRRYNPKFELCIANPGYFTPAIPNMEGVIILGPMPHDQIMDHVRTSLCVFYPNFVFPETFGLVFAESNAVGTPVLTHSLGAAHEILDHPGQMIDCRNIELVVKTLASWSEGKRPCVRLEPMFRMKEIKKEWRKLL